MFIFATSLLLVDILRQQFENIAVCKMLIRTQGPPCSLSCRHSSSPDSLPLPHALMAPFPQLDWGQESGCLLHPGSFK